MIVFKKLNLSKYDLFFIFFLFISLAQRLCFWPSAHMLPDEGLYALKADRLYAVPSFFFSHDAFAYHPPLFSFFLNMGRFFAPGIYGFQLMSIFFSLAGLVAIYAIGRKLQSPFAGLLSAILLSYQFDYLIFSNYVLMDIPLAVIFMSIFFYLINRPNQDKSLGAGIFIAAAMLIKWSAMILLPTCFIYLFLIKSSKDNFFKSSVFLLLPSLTLIFLVALTLGLPSSGGIFSGGYYPKGLFYYVKYISGVLKQDPLLGGFFIFGLLSLLKKPRHYRFSLYLFIAIPFFCVSAASEKISRYLIMVWPFIFLTIAVGIDCFIEMFLVKYAKFARIAFIMIIGGMMLLNMNAYKEYIDYSRVVHSGFEEAGESLKNMKLFSTDEIWAGSVRQVAYFSGLGLADFGGRVKYDKMLSKEFEERVKRTQQAIILVIDRWEFTQPSDIYPFSFEKQRFLEKLGFNLKKVIKMPVSGEVVPVIWILKREHLNNNR